MTRSVMFLMRASKGALSHEQIMRLTWRQFECYLDAASYWLNEESEKGRQQNALYDAVLQSSDEGFQSERQRIIEKSKKFKQHAERKDKGEGERLV